MAESKQINVRVDPGKSFYADNITIAHSPGKFILDFKKSTPRFDQDPESGQATTIFVEHNTLVIDPAMAKELLDALKDNIGKFEKNFGVIKKPKMPKLKAEKKVKEPGVGYIG